MSQAPDVRSEIKQLAERVAEAATRAGADAAEVVVTSGSKLQVKVREGKPELVHEAQSKHLGLRVLREHCAAVSFTSDFSAEGLARFVENAVALSRLTEPDLDNELPGRDELVPRDAVLPELALWDERSLSLDAAYGLAQARAAEAAALAVSPRLRADHGASFSRNTNVSAFACASTSGVLFSGANRGTNQVLYASALCDDKDGKKRSGSEWTSSRFVSGLLSPEEVGRAAGQKALAKVGAEKIDTCELPVVFDPEEAHTLLSLLAQALLGGAIYRRQSYLCEREGQEIASPLCTIVDDPLLPSGPGSRPFDGEGLPSRRNVIVERGVLRSFLFDTYSARKLGRKSNGCAGRTGAGTPHAGTSNFILEADTLAPEALYRDLPRGLYVTEMLGYGFNPVTGDFSRGAGGFLIENGRLSRPVSEVTISAPFDVLWRRVDALGNVLDRRSSIMAPSLRVSCMTVAGR